MATDLATVSGYAFSRTPLSNVTPFTYRDHGTFQRVLYGLIEFINEKHIPELNNLIDEVEKIVNDGSESMNEQLLAAIADFSNRIDAANSINANAIADTIAQVTQMVTDSNALNAAIVENINNKTGNVEIQRATISADYTVTIDPVWPTNHPVLFSIKQDATGGRNIITGANITGGLVVDLNPNAATEFTLLPLGNGTWKVHQPTAYYADTTVTASKQRYPTLDTTGVNIASVILQAAADATPDGGTLVIPAGTYRIAGRITITKNIVVKAYGARFVKTADVPVFDFVGTHETPIGVVSWSKTTTTNDTSSADPAIQLNLVSAPVGWVRGDVVKVYADDVIVAGKPGSTDNTTMSRVGKFLIVTSAAGGVITCLGSLDDDPYTTNVRVSKLTNIAAHIEGGEFSVSDAGLAAVWLSPMLQFRSMAAPSVRNVRIKSSSGTGVRMTGCYGYTIDSLDVDYAKNSPGDGVLGYGISDASSQFGRISNYRARRVRHAYTDGSAEQLAGTVDPSNYGSSYGTQISNSVCYGSANTAWDTHSWSNSITFSDVHAYDSYKAFNLRGRNHRIIDCSAVRCSLGGIYIANEAEGGDTYGHYVSNFLAENVGRRAVEANINQTGYVNAGTRELRKSYINGVTIKGGNALDCMYFVNATVRLDNVVIVPGPANANDDRVVYVHNSDVDGKNWTIDTSNTLSTVTGLVMIYLRNASILKIDGQLDYIGTAASNAIAYGLRFMDATSKAIINNMRSNKALGVAYNTASFDSVIDWEDMTNGQNSAWITASDANITSTTETGFAAVLGRTRARNVHARLTSNAAPVTIAVLPNGQVRGQTLTIWNISSANAITLPNTGYKMQLSPNATRDLLPLERITFVWQNTLWWQVS